MAYATTNPPQCMVPRIGDGQALWVYTSADIHTDVDAAGYFSNGDALGMKVDDVVIVNRSGATAPGATLHKVTAVTSGGAATVSAAILA